MVEKKEVELKELTIEVSKEFYEMMEEGMQLCKDNNIEMDTGEWIEATIFNMSDDIIALRHQLMTKMYSKELPVVKDNKQIKREKNHLNVMYN
jgi:hypothetical protein